MNPRHLLTTLALLAATGCCKSKLLDPGPPAKPEAKPIDAEIVWVVDDGERIARKAGSLPLMSGEGNAVWRPGAPIMLFGLPGETIAFQVIATAEKQPIEGVTVELPALTGPTTIKNPEGKGAESFRPIERFVVHELAMKRRSGGKSANESLGWSRASIPVDPSYGGTVPDPLIPVEHAPSWADYPMTVNPGEHRVVWIDVTLPDRELPAGTYRGTVEIRAKGRNEPMGSIPIEVEVGPVALPFATLPTMVYFEPEDALVRRIGSRGAIDHYQQVMHRHHLSTVYSLRRPEGVTVMQDSLTGKLYTSERGYDGPGRGVGASVIVLGAYGGYGEPEPAKLEEIRGTLEALEALGMRDEPGKRDIFLYAADEQCDSPVGPNWRKLLDGSGDDRLKSLRVGHTCSEPPAAQGVDLVMMIASAYDPKLVEAAVAKGKRVWIYNGQLPQTGAFLTDAWHNSLRANGWIQQKYGIERWFYWESVFWNDGNHGGHGSYDPLAKAETFHNSDGDHCNGDGVLLYPGKQSKEGYLSIGFDGVVPSIRLKQWRRGISDAGYVRLATAVDGSRAAAIVDRIVPKALREAPDSSQPPWPVAGEPWTKARRELFELIRSGR